MNPVFLAAIRAARRAMDDIRHHEHERSLPSPWQQKQQYGERHQDAPVRPSVFMRLKKWLCGLKR